jgi:2'-5' RNA ligase
MLSQSEKNNDLISRLIEVQHQLIEKTEPTVLYFLPVESFHQTIANTLSAERFHKSIVEAGLEATYPDIVQQAFSEISLTNSERQISMKMIGLSLFGTALAMVGIFEDEHDYQAITHFRKSFYANDQLNNLGVKMTRPFIGHVTLAYIESELNEKQTSVLSESIIEINSKWQHKPSYFHISYTELRRYHHLAEFLRPVNYPRYNFHIS